MSIAIICGACLLGGGTTYLLFTWLIRITPFQDNNGCTVRNRSPIRHDYKHRAAPKQSNQFDAGALTGSGLTLVLLAIIVAFVRHGSAS